ncbi:MAG: TrkA family potassium uptake protein [bacterium]|nr:TrkA family potassium uptake protein [bacterium]
MGEKKFFAVIGLGSFGYYVATKLAEKGYEVIAIDIDENKIDDISNKVTHAIQLNALDEKGLKEVGLMDVDVAIIAIKDIATSILLSSFLKEDLKIKYVVAKASDQKHGKVLEKIGVDRIIYPEIESAERLAKNLISPSIFDIIELSSSHNLVEIKAPDIFVGKTLEEIDLRKRFDINIIAIKRNQPSTTETYKLSYEESIIISPSPKERIIEGDILVMVGLKEHLEKIEKL